MVKKRRVHIFLIIILCVLIVPIGLLGCRGKEQKTVTAADQFLLAIVNDTAPKKERFQVLTYVAIDSEKGLFAITVPEETKIEMPGVGYNRIKHALNFKDLSLTSRSIAKFVGSSEEQGHYIAIDAKYIATIVDDAGGLYIKRSDSTLGGDAALEALYWAAKEGKPEMQHAIVSAILERLVSANEFPGVAGALKKGAAQGEVNTNLDGEEFKKTMSSLGGLEEVTVVLLPGLVNEDDGIYYWVPRVAVLNDLRRKVTKEGLSAGIGYVAEQVQKSSKKTRIATKGFQVAGVKLSPGQGVSTSTTRAVETTASATLRTKEYTIDVFNGGRVVGSAIHIGQRLQSKGFKVGVVGDLSGSLYQKSVILYVAGREQEARKVAGALGISTVRPLSGIISPRSRGQIIVVVGRDAIDRNAIIW